MFSSYFLTAYRNLRRNKVYAGINIAGLAVGLAAALLILLVVRFETSYDTFRPDVDRIYRVVASPKGPQGISYHADMQTPMGPAIRAEIPTVGIATEVYGDFHDQVTLFADAQHAVERKVMENKIFFTEPQFFDIFPTKWLAGNASLLNDRGAAVLSVTRATTYFGSWQNALGKTLKIDNKYLVTVKGIVADPPANTDFPMHVMVSYYVQPADRLTNWGNTNSGYYVFLKLAKGSTVAQATQQLHTFGERHRIDPELEAALGLQPLKEMHFDERYGSEYSHVFSHALINALLLIGVFLLCIAAVNFINLATAQAVNRSREVGVRKALGSARGQLIGQFLTETFVITLVAALFAVALAFSGLPLLNSMLDAPLPSSALLQPASLACLAALVVVLALLSGLYPTLVMSGFSAVAALKSRMTAKTVGGLRLRGLLVVFQFVIAQVLIIGMLVVVKQMNFFRGQDLGFNKDNVMMVRVPSDSAHRPLRLALQQRLLNYPGILNASLCFSAPTDYNNWGSGFDLSGSTHRGSDFGANLKWTDSSYFRLFGLRVMAGRVFQQAGATEFVVNEELIRRLGLKSPEDILGHEMAFNGGKLRGPVVGVVHDYNVNSLREPLEPVVMMPSAGSHEQNLALKVRGDDMKTTLAYLQKEYEAAFPDDIFEYEFLDRRIANFYSTEERLSKLYGIFAGLAIFISCLGLYGLVTFMTVQRNKEMGIRKVLGANVTQIVGLFFKEFAVLIGIAFLIAAPMAYWGLQNWLNAFTYRIHLGPGIFLATIAASMLFAWITVGYQSIRAALANPVQALRSE